MIKRMSARIFILVISFTPLFAESGDELLAKVESALSGPADYEGRARMILANSDGSGREIRELRMWLAGKDKRVIKFLSPPGIEGIGLLTEGEDSMYLYLPAQNKIRKIEGGLKNEEFQGTDFSYAEMGSYEYKKDFSAVITGEEADTYTLTLTRREGSDKSYDKLVMVVDKSSSVPKKVELYRDDKLKKIFYILEIERSEGFIIPVHIKMENLERGHYTEMTIDDTRFNQGLLNRDIFSKRFLKKRAE